MSIIGVLFDKDGTLVDFDETWGPTTHAVIHALAQGDPGLMRAQAEALHFSLESRRFLPSSPLIAGSSASYGPSWGEALGRTDFAELKREIDRLSAVESLKALTPIGAPAAALGALKAMGLRLGVATNDSEASARRQIGALGLDEAIEFIAGYDTGHGGKPDPGMVLAFARHLGAPPSRIAMVGDSLHDLDAARAAGALAIAVLSGPAPPSELAPRADHVVADIEALPALFAALAREA
ncbi:MAG: HAD family hydrolase [Hyphomicrobiales bacterium]|nr:HAD family hydrolase [Hyphomicrobiales bacterium]